MKKLFLSCLIVLLCIAFSFPIYAQSTAAILTDNPIDRAFSKVTYEQPELENNMIFAYVYALKWYEESVELLKNLSAEEWRIPYSYIWKTTETAFEYARWNAPNNPTAQFISVAHYYRMLAYDCLARLVEHDENATFVHKEDELYQYLIEVEYGGLIPDDFENLDLFSLIRDNLNPMPAIAALPSDNIYFYYTELCAVLSIDGDYILFPWNDYITPRGVLPKLSLSDFDSDGDDELAVVLYVGSGTGISIEELHIIELSGDWLLWDNLITSQQIERQLLHRLSAYYDSEFDRVEIRLDDQTVLIDTSNIESAEALSLDFIDLNSICYFNVEDSAISVNISIGLCDLNLPIPFDYVELYADIIYDKYMNVSIENCRLMYLYD